MDGDTRAREWWLWYTKGLLGVAGMAHTYHREPGRPDPGPEAREMVKKAIRNLVIVFGQEVLNG